MLGGLVRSKGGGEAVIVYVCVRVCYVLRERGLLSSFNLGQPQSARDGVCDRALLAFHLENTYVVLPGIQQN